MEAETISWYLIVQTFHREFVELCLNKKAHFDYDKGQEESEVLTIDGATRKWEDPILLNAVLCSYKNRLFMQTKRGFDQHKILKKCVINVLTKSNKLAVIPSSTTVLTAVVYPWNSFENFRDYMLNFKHSKQNTREKVSLICDTFHSNLYDNKTLPEILNQVVSKIWTSSMYLVDLHTRRPLKSRDLSLLGDIRSDKSKPSLPHRTVLKSAEEIEEIEKKKIGESTLLVAPFAVAHQPDSSK